MARAAIVTGSDSGIGKATAVALAERGYDVGVTWHEDEEGARETAAEVESRHARALVRRLDLEQLDEVRAAIGELADGLGGIEVLVNNAGTSNQAPFLEFGLDDFRRDLAVKLTGPFLASQEAARRMIDAGNGGAIVNVTSVHEHVPLENSAAYCAANAGLGMLTKVLALELGEHGIRVNSIAPGEIATAMTGQEDEDPRGHERRVIPLGRPGDAREIASWIAFLASPDSGYATGASFVVDGGLLLMAAQANQLV